MHWGAGKINTLHAWASVQICPDFGGEQSVANGMGQSQHCTDREAVSSDFRSGFLPVLKSETASCVTKPVQEGLWVWVSGFCSHQRCPSDSHIKEWSGPLEVKRVTVSALPTTTASFSQMGIKHWQLCTCSIIQLGSRERATCAHGHEEMPNLLVLYRSLTKERPHYHSWKPSSGFSAVWVGIQDFNLSPRRAVLW